MRFNVVWVTSTYIFMAWQTNNEYLWNWYSKKLQQQHETNLKHLWVEFAYHMQRQLRYSFWIWHNCNILSISYELEMFSTFKVNFIKLWGPSHVLIARMSFVEHNHLQLSFPQGWTLRHQNVLLIFPKTLCLCCYQYVIGIACCK